MIKYMQICMPIVMEIINILMLELFMIWWLTVALIIECLDGNCSSINTIIKDLSLLLRAN